MTSPLNREELIKRIVMIKITQVYPDDLDKTLRNQAASIAPVIDQYAQQVANEARIDELGILARNFAHEPFDATATIYAQNRIAELEQMRSEP